MPPDDHTHKQPSAPTLTTSLTRKICWTCADRAHRKRPPGACHRHHLDPLHRSSDFKATKQPTGEHLGHAGKNRLPKSTPRPELHSTSSSLPNRNQRPASANHAAKMPPSTAKMPQHNEVKCKTIGNIKFQEPASSLSSSSTGKRGGKNMRGRFCARSSFATHGTGGIFAACISHRDVQRWSSTSSRTNRIMPKN